MNSGAAAKWAALQFSLPFFPRKFLLSLWTCKDRLEGCQHSQFSFHACCTASHLQAYMTAIPKLSSTHPTVPANAERQCQRAQVCESKSRVQSPHWEPRLMFGSKVQSHWEAGPEPSSHIDERVHGWISQYIFISFLFILLSATLMDWCGLTLDYAAMFFHSGFSLILPLGSPSEEWIQQFPEVIPNGLFYR